MTADWAYIVAALCSTVLGVERQWRLRDETVTLTQRAIVVSLFAVGIGGVAYGTMPFTAHLWNVGSLVWHIAASVLIGALEIIFLTLRSEQVDNVALRRVAIRAGLVSLLLLAAWATTLNDRPEDAIATQPGQHDFSSVVNLIIFPAHAIWGLAQGVRSSIRRIPKDFNRRPISTFALAMVATGLTGFIAINSILIIQLNLGVTSNKESILAFSPVALGVCVSGAVLLAIGERLHEELSARLQLAQLKPLWSRMIELSPHDVHLPVQHLPTPARLQRAYVEISDAICTLRLDAEDCHDLGSVVSALRRGDVSEDAMAPTLSQALPARSTRREDLELIGALAKAYRQVPRERADVHVDHPGGTTRPMSRRP
ncbi:DUF6545 domain-containing protein [Brachybacterium sacelli]|uniref:DUF6545 domain-containing protein n=2 Tax=Brachybacterium sacelli TaxID=173364 RepID=A0ABS4X5P4_9MICO|nr:DUF6545 domain-containing protein [Brachybacterium sacelli]MBP2383782.1 hypothetical protein [Brachybacterium sacelli]